MAENSKIEWCHHTANLWWGCEELAGHPACKHCYAKVLARAVGKGDAWSGVRYAPPRVWKAFAKFQKQAQRAGEVHRVFVNSMSDLFEKALPAHDWKTRDPLGITTEDLRFHYFRAVVPETQNLLHLLLTKRPGNIIKQVPMHWIGSHCSHCLGEGIYEPTGHEEIYRCPVCQGTSLGDWPTNVMTGTSVSDQDTADTLIPQLLRAPGRHFLSVEPLIRPISLHRWLGAMAWVIVGGESGPWARPMHPNLVRSIRDQCLAAGVPFFFKQWGTFREHEGPRVRGTASHAGLFVLPSGGLGNQGDWWDGRAVAMDKVGKKDSGRLLDGVEWSQFPDLSKATS